MTLFYQDPGRRSTTNLIYIISASGKVDFKENNSSSGTITIIVVNFLGQHLVKR